MIEIFKAITEYSVVVGKVGAVFGLSYYMWVFYEAFTERLSLFDVGIFKLFLDPRSTKRLEIIGNNILLLMISVAIPLMVGYSIPVIIACVVVFVYGTTLVLLAHTLNVICIIFGASIFALCCFISRAGRDEQKRVIKEIIDSCKNQNLNKQ
jgi:hypothetical protein